jgi:hypothetical protein
MLAILRIGNWGRRPIFCSIIALISSGKSRRLEHPEPPVGEVRP